MPRYRVSFERRRKGVCSNCHTATLQVVTYALDQDPNWWCTRCGGWTTAGMVSFPGNRAMAAAARRVYLAVPPWSEKRKRDWRQFRRHISPGVTLDVTDTRV